jgi:Zn-dependent protease
MPALGWAKPLEIDPDRLRLPRRDGLLIALAGPAVNLALALAGIALVLGLQAAGAFPAQHLGNSLLAFCLVNANLAAFGLLPIPPLSGASAIEPFLDGDALTAFEEIKPYGFLLLLVGAYLNFFDFITQPVTRLVLSILDL